MCLANNKLPQIRKSQSSFVLLFADASALKFRTHSPGQKTQQHFKICHDRPKRITECRGFITLNKTMAQPGKQISAENRQRQEHPFLRNNNRQQAQDRQNCSSIVPASRRRPFVFLKIVRPKFSKSSMFTHRQTTSQDRYQKISSVQSTGFLNSVKL